MSLLSCEVKLSAKCLLSMNNINPNNNLLHGLREVVAMLSHNCCYIYISCSSGVTMPPFPL